MQHDVFISCVAPKTTAQSSRALPKMVRCLRISVEWLAGILGYPCLPPMRQRNHSLSRVLLKVAFTWPWRKSEPQKNKTLGWLPMYTKPDLDNLSKIFVDSMVTCGWLVSDQIIWKMTLMKGWGDRTGVHIRWMMTGMEL